jgi:hypothetical protein
MLHFQLIEIAGRTHEAIGQMPTNGQGAVLSNVSLKKILGLSKSRILNWLTKLFLMSKEFLHDCTY